MPHVQEGRAGHPWSRVICQLLPWAQLTTVSKSPRDTGREDPVWSEAPAGRLTMMSP